MLLALDSVVAVVGTILGAGLAVLAAYTFARSRFGRPAPGTDVLRASVCDVKLGGVVKLGGFGDDREDVVLTIETLAHVRLGAEEWHDLVGSYRGRALLLEWRRRPSGLLRVAAFKKARVPLTEVGLEQPTLDGVRAGGTVTALGTAFRVEEVGDAIRATAKESLAERCWWLIDEERRQVLRVERVGEQPAVASVGVLVASDGVEIVKL